MLRGWGGGRGDVAGSAGGVSRPVGVVVVNPINVLLIEWSEDGEILGRIPLSIISVLPRCSSF